MSARREERIVELTPDGAELWRLTLLHSPVGMAVVDLDGRVLLANRALAEMLGRDAGSLREHGFQELTHPDDLETDLGLFRQAMRGEIDSYRLRKRYLHADGHVVWGDLSVALVRAPDGRPLHCVSQILDVTEQIEREREVAAANARVEREREILEAVFETVNVGLLLIGPDGHYERMNRRHRETMDVPFPDGHEGEAGQLGHVYHLDGVTMMTRGEMPSTRATQGEDFDDYRYWVGSDPRTRAAYTTSARQVRSPSGERIGAALAYQEITDLVRALERQDEFVSSMSHELRTPLTSMLGYLELLVEEDLPGPVGAQLAVVQRNAQRLATLLSDLLLVGQLGEAGFTLARSEVDLVALATQAVDAARPSADGSGIAMTVEAPDHLPAYVDGQRIRQVLDNLLSNAVKYSEAGDVVTVVLERRPDAVAIEVRDTGLGIAPDQVAQVFERFFRGDGALAKHLPGTGLGLDIVRSIVTAHGGSIGAESNLGSGSTFRVLLPTTG